MLNNNKAVELISGYRSLATNNHLRQHTSGVAKKAIIPVVKQWISV